MSGKNKYIAEIFEQEQLAAPEKIQQALAQATQERCNLIDILFQSGFTKEILYRHLANHFSMEFTSITPQDLSPDLASLFNADDASRYQTVPVEKKENVVIMAISDPLDLETLDTIRYLFSNPIDFVVAIPEEINTAITSLYPQSNSAMSSVLEDLNEREQTQLNVEVLSEYDDHIGEKDEPIIKLVNQLIIEAFKLRASDIHLEPLSSLFRVRYRIDGVLREVDSPPRRLHPSVISRLKIMSNMKISEKRLPQDGRAEINVGGRPLDLRVSAIPTNHGESIVMRILDKEGLMLGLPNLGFLSDDQQTFERLISLPDGILLITGPTGSGKTTTLYACLNELNHPNRKIITVEDPVEYQLSGINQVQVHSEIGLSFSASLRSILRQAPNTIMIGEIRDKETAEIAVNAALTGHLVLSTLHTNDAPSAITRLIDIGVKPFLVSSSVRGIMAQRLIRSICPKCKTEHIPSELELKMLGTVASQMNGIKLYQGQGCEHCNNAGYLGRKGLFEILSVNDDVRHMIHDGVTASELRNKARELGMRTLREDGLRKTVSGMTTLNEVFRVTMRDEN